PRADRGKRVPLRNRNQVAAFSAIVLSDEDIDSEVARLWSRWALFAETATRLHCNLVAAFRLSGTSRESPAKPRAAALPRPPSRGAASPAARRPHGSCARAPAPPR